MSSRLFVVGLLLSVVAIPATRSAADEPTSPATTTPAPKPATPSTHKIETTNVMNGQVEKISDTSMTIKVVFQTGGKVTVQHANVAHISRGWLPHVVVGHPVTGVHTSKSRTIVQHITYQIGEIPPVKVVMDGPRPSRTTGAYSDVKVGDLVMIGTGPVKTKNADGKSTTHTQVTGIDVLKHPHGDATSTTTANKPNKN